MVVVLTTLVTCTYQAPVHNTSTLTPLMASVYDFVPFAFGGGGFTWLGSAAYSSGHASSIGDTPLFAPALAALAADPVAAFLAAAFELAAAPAFAFAAPLALALGAFAAPPPAELVRGL